MSCRSAAVNSRPASFSAAAIAAGVTACDCCAAARATGPSPTKAGTPSDRSLKKLRRPVSAGGDIEYSAMIVAILRRRSYHSSGCVPGGSARKHSQIATISYKLGTAASGHNVDGPSRALGHRTVRPRPTTSVSAGEFTMNRPRLTLFHVLAMLAICSSTAYAQSAFTGVVKDATGGLLPGVTVEASSPALIEKTKSAVTDERGQYRIVELRPGVYSLPFTLPGFRTVRRDGLELIDRKSVV